MATITGTSRAVMASRLRAGRSSRTIEHDPGRTTRTGRASGEKRIIGLDRRRSRPESHPYWPRSVCTKRPRLIRRDPLAITGCRLPSCRRDVIAHLATTNGREVSDRFKYGALSKRARPFTTKFRPASPSFSMTDSPRPFTLGNGSVIATTTRAIPAASMASVHGGVLPKWQHGSRVT